MEVDVIEKAAIGGHNMFIFGQAGTGKTFLIRRLFSRLVSIGKKTKLTATTGIASSSLQGMTIHKFCGILDGRFTGKELVARISNEVDFADIKTRVCETDCVFIDEISMLSLKNFKTFEYLCRNLRNLNSPFGGLQVILTGDFYQLKPVANPKYRDTGDMIINAEDIKSLIPHHFVLKKVYRQTEGDLISAVHELSTGVMNEETKAFLLSLSRPLPPERQIVKLFEEKLSVEKCNADNLLSMPGFVCLVP